MMTVYKNKKNSSLDDSFDYFMILFATKWKLPLNVAILAPLSGNFNSFRNSCYFKAFHSQFVWKKYLKLDHDNFPKMATFKLSRFSKSWQHWLDIIGIITAQVERIWWNNDAWVELLIGQIYFYMWSRPIYLQVMCVSK